MKERNRILHDKNYRRFAITRNDALSKAKTDEEKMAEDEDNTPLLLSFFLPEPNILRNVFYKVLCQ